MAIVMTNGWLDALSWIGFGLGLFVVAVCTVDFVLWKRGR